MQKIWMGNLCKPIEGLKTHEEEQEEEEEDDEEILNVTGISHNVNDLNIESL